MYNFVQLYNLFTDMMTHLDPRKQQSPENGIHVVSNGLYSTIIMSISKITLINLDAEVKWLHL